jgi:hypothetical protein
MTQFFATLSNSAEIFSSFLLANHQGYCNGAQTDPAFRSPQLNLSASSEALNYSPNFAGRASHPEQ